MSEANGNYKMRTVRQPKELTRDSIGPLEQANPALKVLNDAWMEMPRGFKFTKQDVGSVIKTDDERLIKKTLTKFRDVMLWVKGIAVEWCPATKAYVFRDVDHELGIGHDRRQAAIERKAKREALRLALIPEDDLQTDHLKLRRMHLVQQTTSVANKVNADRSMAELWHRQPETLPRLR